MKRRSSAIVSRDHAVKKSTTKKKEIQRHKLCANYVVEHVSLFLKLQDLLSLRSCSPGFCTAWNAPMINKSIWIWNNLCELRLNETCKHIKKLKVQQYKKNLHELPHTFPNVQRLILFIENSKHFNANLFPNTLLHLSLQGFNCPLTCGLLPQTLLSLRLGDCFNSLVESNALPISLTNLHFGLKFDQSLGNITLPPNLLVLHLGVEFSKQLDDNFLPLHLKELNFGYCYNFPIKNMIFPTSLTVLYFGHYFYQAISDEQKTFLPPYLKKLKMSGCSHPFHPHTLPPTLLHFSTNNSYTKFLNGHILPSSLRKLRIGCLFPGISSSSLTVLHFCYGFDQAIEPRILPNTLTQLKMGMLFNYTLKLGTFPSSLKTLHLSTFFNQVLQANVFPPFLEILDMGAKFNQSLKPGVFPTTLTSLHMSQSFNHAICRNVLPCSLRHLYLGIKFKKLIQPHVLPMSLEHLYKNEVRLPLPLKDKVCDYFLSEFQKKQVTFA